MTQSFQSETGQILKVGPLSLNNNGEKYHCVVSNISSSIESNKALLTVRRPSSHTLIITGDLFTSKNVKSELMKMLISFCKFISICN